MKKSSSFLKKGGMVFVLLVSLFIIFESIVRYENFGWNFLSYKSMKSEKHWYNSEFIYDIEDVTGSVPLDPEKFCPDLHGMVPNKKGYFKGADFNINSWGLRDKEYEIEKSKGTFRFALIADSMSVPFGVNIEDSYHWIVEDELNKKSDKADYEIVNMAYGGIRDGCRLKTVERSLKINPDAVLVSAISPNKENIEFLVNFQRRNKIPVILFYLEEVRPYSQLKGLMFTSLNVSRGNDYIYRYDQHPNEKVHRKYADGLLDFLLKHEIEIHDLSEPYSEGNGFEIPGFKENLNVVNGFWRSYFIEKIRNRIKTDYLHQELIRPNTGAPLISKSSKS